MKRRKNEVILRSRNNQVVNPARVSDRIFLEQADKLIMELEEKIRNHRDNHQAFISQKWT